MPGSGGQNESKGSKRGSKAPSPRGLCPDPTHKGHLTPSFTPSGTIPPIKSAQGEGDDVKKLFTIGCPVILATLGVALLFIVRKKRKEKRLKRLRGSRASYGLPGEGVLTLDLVGHLSLADGHHLDKRKCLCPIEGRAATPTF